MRKNYKHVIDIFSLCKRNLKRSFVCESMEALQERSEITTVIKNVSHQQGIKNFTIAEVKTNQRGEGYEGDIFMVAVRDNDNGNHLDIVIKAAFIDEKVRRMAPIRMSYQNEIYFYTNVYPVFEKFEKKRKVVQPIKLVPKCLEVSVKEREEMLVLENLKTVGFEIFDKKSVLDEAHMQLIFQTYGRLHAYSFALRDQQPEKYLDIVEGLYDVRSQLIKQCLFAERLANMWKLATKSLIPGKDDEVKKEFQKYSGSNMANIFENVAAEISENPAILHGDCWSNNMLFRYKDDGSGKKPTELRLIDWQLMKVGSPVCDLSFCLYSGGSKKHFDNLNNYLQVYYNSFSSFLRELGSDPDKLFSFSALKEHWRKYAKFGMIISLVILKMKLTDTEDVVDLRDGFEMEEYVSVIANLKFCEDDFNERVRELLLHMLEVNAL